MRIADITHMHVIWQGANNIYASIGSRHVWPKNNCSLIESKVSRKKVIPFI